ncbi:SDR family NAD(P)-dependent oxidoreductase [Amycolatopsis albispora]|uniref:Short-chain dehydrogenase n=1 Tax=Amycolatopsis albispora TaxID=1804986 RepID=A0A344LM09_9PSEU|nr:SDR family oxidoreductase [Amycolatopsis albispora]AXB49083.1 short-chain dehydrogenase [Amycolatopsis albispora]
MELQDQRALVTGATSGIGRATVKTLAREGATVIVTGRNAEGGAKVVAEIEADGGRASFIAADMADLDSVRRLAAEVGDVDVLVNNAGIFPFAPTLEQDVPDFDAMFDVNVRAPYFLTAALVPKMLAKGAGSIINVTSIAASVGMPDSSVYGASKAALESLTRTWAAEFRGSGVRVNNLSPGPVHTEKVLAQNGDLVAELGRTTLLGRTAAPEEIAEVVLFLASPRSSYLTGTTITADGGAVAV